MREGGVAATPGRVGVAVSRRVGERHRVGLREGFGEGGVLGHVRLVLLQRVAEARQHRMLCVELAVSWYQHRGQHWGHRNTVNCSLVGKFDTVTAD